MKKDYLVKGAKLMCVNGKGIVELEIPKGHGYDEKRREAQSAITPTAGGIITGQAPKGWYQSLINQGTNNLFAINQVSGAFSTVIWEGIII